MPRFASDAAPATAQPAAPARRLGRFAAAARGGSARSTSTPGARLGRRSRCSARPQRAAPSRAGAGSSCAACERRRARARGCASGDLTRRAGRAEPAREPCRPTAATRPRRCSPRSRPARLGGEARPRTSSASPAPPGAGKSTLLSALDACVARGRAHGGGAGGRSRPPSAPAVRCSATGRGSTPIPADRGLFIRSTAAGERLGGLAPRHPRRARQALAAAFDVVVIETRRRRPVARPRSPRRPTRSRSSCSRARRRAAVPEGGDHGGARRAGGDQGRPRRRWRSARGATSHAALRSLGESRRAGRGGLLGPAARPGSTSWWPRSTSTGPGSTCAAARTRARRLGALADFTAEHGERGLRALGGRREARALAAGAGPGPRRGRAAARARGARRSALERRMRPAARIVPGVRSSA